MRRRTQKRRSSDTALLLTGRTIGFIAIASAFLAVASFWTEYDLSGEVIGRALDNGAARIAMSVWDTESALSTEPSSGT